HVLGLCPGRNVLPSPPLAPPPLPRPPPYRRPRRGGGPFAPSSTTSRRQPGAPCPGETRTGPAREIRGRPECPGPPYGPAIPGARPSRAARAQTARRWLLG